MFSVILFTFSRWYDAASTAFGCVYHPGQVNCGARRP